MISHKITLLTTLGIGTIGGIATGGYFLFKPEDKSNTISSSKGLTTESSSDNPTTQLSDNPHSLDTQAPEAIDSGSRDVSSPSDPAQTQVLPSGAGGQESDIASNQENREVA